MVEGESFSLTAFCRAFSRVSSSRWSMMPDTSAQMSEVGVRILEKLFCGVGVEPRSVRSDVVDRRVWEAARRDKGGLGTSWSQPTE
jgi:hypothetical protein